MTFIRIADDHFLQRTHAEVLCGADSGDVTAQELPSQQRGVRNRHLAAATAALLGPSLLLCRTSLPALLCTPRIRFAKRTEQGNGLFMSPRLARALSDWP